MTDNRLPRWLLYGELTVDQRSVGRPMKRFVDHIKANLLKCNINQMISRLWQVIGMCEGLCATLVSAGSAKTGSLPLKHDALKVTELLQSQRPVHDALSAAESVHPSSDYGVTCCPIPSLTTLRNSATSSSNPTDFSSSSRCRMAKRQEGVGMGWTMDCSFPTAQCTAMAWIGAREGTFPENDFYRATLC